MKKIKTDITPQQLREAAEMALKLDEFLDKCNREGVLALMGFDLDFLANRFENAVRRVEAIAATHVGS